MTFEQFKKKMESFHNHICLLYGTDIVRLLGVGMDEYDYYYITQDLHGKIVWSSAVGFCDSLASLSCYSFLVSRFELYNLPPSKEFLCEAEDNSGLYKEINLD